MNRKGRVIETLLILKQVISQEGWELPASGQEGAIRNDPKLLQYTLTTFGGLHNLDKLEWPIV